MRQTTVVEKLLASVYNALIALVISLPAGLYLGFETEWKFITVAIFFLMQVFDTHQHAAFRCFGMRIIGTHWARRYSAEQKALYSVLYTLSFATLFVHVYVPFDVFLFNMLFLQLPCILMTGTTLHGYLSGGMRSVREL